MFSLYHTCLFLSIVKPISRIKTRKNPSATALGLWKIDRRNRCHFFGAIACLIKRRSVAGKGHSQLRLLMCERAIKTIKLGKECKVLMHTVCPRLWVGAEMNQRILLGEITELPEATTEISIISKSTLVLPCAGRTRGAVVVACECHREKGSSADLYLSRPMRQDWRGYSSPSPSLKLAQEMQRSQLSSNPSFLSGDYMVSSSLKSF